MTVYILVQKFFDDSVTIKGAFGTYQEAQEAKNDLPDEPDLEILDFDLPE